MFRARLLPPTTEQKQQKLEEKTIKFFSVQLFLFLLKLLGFLFRFLHR